MFTEEKVFLRVSCALDFFNISPSSLDMGRKLTLFKDFCVRLIVDVCCCHLNGINLYSVRNNEPTQRIVHSCGDKLSFRTMSKKRMREEWVKDYASCGNRNFEGTSNRLCSQNFITFSYINTCKRVYTNTHIQIHMYFYYARYQCCCSCMYTHHLKCVYIYIWSKSCVFNEGYYF